MRRLWYHLRSFADNARALGCLVVIALIVIFLIASVIVHFVDRPNTTPETAYRIYTDTRLYLSDDVVPIADGYRLNGYWDIQRDRWEYHKENFTMSRDIFGEITIEPEITP